MTKHVQRNAIFSNIRRAHTSLCAAVLGCCLLAAGSSQAAPYRLEMHTAGYATVFAGAPGFEGGQCNGCNYDITYRAVVNFAQGPGWSSASTSYEPVEVSISFHGGLSDVHTVKPYFYLRWGADSTDLIMSYDVSFVPKEFAVWDFEFASLGQILPDAAGVYRLPRTPVRGGFSIDSFGDEGAYLGTSAYGSVDSVALTLSPVPEPAAWTMLGAGLLLTGAVAGRRRR